MALLKDLTVYGVTRLISDAFTAKVMVNTNSTTYDLNVGGDSYVTGWSRAGSGFYCHDTGVYYTHKSTSGEINIASSSSFLISANSTTLSINAEAVSRGTLVNKYVWNANAATTYATHVMKAIELFPTNNSSYSEGIRIHTASNNWNAVVLCSVANTGATGTDANTWGIYNNNGVFSIAKNSSSYNANCAIGNSGGTWYINNRLTINSSGKVIPVANYYNAGMYGNYASTRLGHIWSIGTDYYMNANGLSPNTAYGMLYFHTNWSNNSTYNTANTTKTALGTYAEGHQIGFFNNGVLGVSIGLAGNIWNNGYLKNKGSIYTTSIYGGCNSTFTTNYWSIDGSANVSGKFTFTNTVDFNDDTNYTGTARFYNDVKIGTDDSPHQLEHYGNYRHYGQTFQYGNIDMSDYNINNVGSIIGTGSIDMGDATFESLTVNGTTTLNGRANIYGTIDATGQSFIIGDITASGTVRTNGDLITHNIKPAEDSSYNIGNSSKFYKSLFVNNIFSNNYLVRPAGANYRTGFKKITGALCITLPANIGNTYVSMWIDIYNYNIDNTSCSVHVGGYTSGSTWNSNSFATVYGADHRVRLGHSGTSFQIYIGQLNTVWTSPQISVRDVILGGTAFNIDNWKNSWTITFATSFYNITWNDYNTPSLSHYAWTTRNLLGPSAIGSTSTPIYWSGRRFYACTNISSNSVTSIGWYDGSSGTNANKLSYVKNGSTYYVDIKRADTVDGVHIKVLTEAQWGSTTPVADTLYVIT